jgi:hypothetical protein
VKAANDGSKMLVIHVGVQHKENVEHIERRGVSQEP